MGILNLLKELQPATVDTHLAAWSGHTLGVDAMGWLHRSAFSCAMELARNEADPDAHAHPLAYLRWLRRMLHMCRALGVRLLVVFDGAALPAKSGTNAARDSLRASHRARADALYASGARDAAAELYGRCVSVSASMRRNFQHMLRVENVPFIVAPFEADAQLAHLYRSGRISGAITEDSDLLAFGCECLLLKLDRDGNARLLELRAVVEGEWHKGAEAVLYKLKRILRAHRSDEDGTAAAATAVSATGTSGPRHASCSSSSSASASSSSSAAASSNSAAASSSSASVPPLPSSGDPLARVGHTRFLHACVLSGCDYLSSLHGIGLKKAVALVDEHRLLEPLLYFLKDARKKLETKWRKDREKAARTLLHAKHAAAAAAASQGNDPPPRSSPTPEEEEAVVAAAAADTEKMSTAEYISHFFRAVATFQHQLVYDVERGDMVHLNPLPPQLRQLWERSLRDERRAAHRDEGKNGSAASAAAASPAVMAPTDRDVHVIDSDDDDDEQKQAEAETERQEAAALRAASASFPSFRDVTEATASHAALLSCGGLLPEPPLPAAHPLLQLRSFSFLGSPLPAHVDPRDWVAGRVDPRTMRPYAPGFRPADLAHAERASAGGAARGGSNGSNGSAGKDQTRPAWRRQGSAAAAAPAISAASKSAKLNFFGRSSSSSSSAASSAPARPASGWSCGVSAAAARQPYLVSAAVTSSQRQQDLGELEGLFGGDDDGDNGMDDAYAHGDAAAAQQWGSDAAAAVAAGEDEGVMAELLRQDAAVVDMTNEGAETQRLDEIDDEMTVSIDADASLAAAPPSSSASASAPWSAAAAPLAAAAPSSPINPFARVLRPVEDVATFADNSVDGCSGNGGASSSSSSGNSAEDQPCAPAATLSAMMPVLSASSALGKLLGLGSSASAAAASKAPSRPFFVIKQAAVAVASVAAPSPPHVRAISAPSSSLPPTRLPSAPAPSAASALCDLTTSSSDAENDCEVVCGGDGEGSGSGGKPVTAATATATAAAPSLALATPPLKRKASAPASSTHHTGSAGSRRPSPTKRKKSGPATPLSGAGAAPGSLLSFFRKST